MKFKRFIAGMLATMSIASVMSINASAASISMRGDVDGDGWITSNDAEVLRLELSSLGKLTKSELYDYLDNDMDAYNRYFNVLDVNSDGTVNLADKRLVKNKAKDAEIKYRQFRENWSNYDINHDYSRAILNIPKVNSTDVGIVRQCVNGNTKYSQYKCYADVNDDGKLTATDVSIIAKKAKEYDKALKTLKTQTSFK